MWMLPLYLHVNQNSDDDDDVTKMGKFNHPCIGRKMIFVLYLLKGLKCRSDYLGD